MVVEGDGGESCMVTRVIGGREQRLVRMRVLKKGHGIIFTGELDPVSNKSTKFSEGEIFEGPAENLELYEERGWTVRAPFEQKVEPAPAEPGSVEPASVEKVRPAIPAVAQALPQGENGEAIARLAARSLRDDKSGWLVWQGAGAE